MKNFFDKELLSLIIVLIFIVAITLFLSFKGCNMIISEINKQGLKGIVEEIWEGNKNECN